MDEKKNTVVSEFTSKKRTPDSKKGHRYRTYLKSRVTTASKQYAKAPRMYKNLARNTFICAVIILALVGIKNIDTTITKEFINGVSTAVNSEFVIDKDLGKLKFVSATKVDYSVPMDGDVVSTFSETGKNVVIQGEDYAVVSAVLSGKVKETGENYVVIENINGTVSTYTGLRPCVLTGDTVMNSDPVGELTENTLILETAKGEAYIDSLSASDMTAEE